MRLLITGEGRSGTCWLTAILNFSDFYDFTINIEDRLLFQRDSLPELYATKLATDNPTFNWKNINRLMARYSDLSVLFSVRHPVSLAMAKTANQDTDISKINSLSPNKFVYIHINSIKKMYILYKKLKIEYPDRVHYTKLENRIINIEKEIKNICKILNIKFNDMMINAHCNTQNMYHQQRYGSKIDKIQADIYQNWQTVYSGYFKDKKNIIDIIKKELNNIPNYFNYKINA